jgi:hypothetical protein
MTMQHDTIPYPLSISEDAQERAAAGQRVASLVEQGGFRDLRKGIRAYQATVTARMMRMNGQQAAAEYADLVGELKGVAAIEQIAAGLIQVGEEAETEIRSVEEGGT